jgi:formylglycine-generating enzyme required for sulfatase activity
VPIRRLAENDLPLGLRFWPGYAAIGIVGSVALGEKDFSSAAEKLAKKDRKGAVAAVAGVLTTFATGHPVLGGLAAGAVQTVAEALTDKATKRFLEAGREWDEEAQRALQRLLLKEVRALATARAENDRDTLRILLEYVADKEGQERDHADLREGQNSIYAEMLELRSRLEQLLSRSQSGPDVLATYRECLRVDHQRLGGLFAEHVSDLSTVFVELDLQAEARAGARGELECDPSERYGLRKTTGLTLRELMEYEPGRRWVVLGDPGAGKSTVARHLVWDLAGAADGPLPVYVSLPELAREKAHPFDMAEQQLRAAKRGAVGGGLADVLAEVAARPGGLWLFLDGLDEVTAEQRHWVNKQLQQWATDLPEVTICVLSRPVGYRVPGPAYAKHQARIQALSDDKQRDLLKKWLGDENRAQKLCDRLHAGLRDACRVPLILSLLAFLTRIDREVPNTKLRLYDRSLRTLLERGHGDRPGGVENADYARVILGELSLQLQEQSGETWPRKALDSRLLKLQTREEEVRERLAVWGSPTAFLQDIAQKSGVIAAHDGPPAPWRFLHRQFRELLAAEALHRQGRETVIARAEDLKPEEIPRWADVLGFACELADEPLEVLKALAEVSEDLALRVLPEVERVNAVEALKVLGPKDKDGKKRQWDGDFLVGLLDRWTKQEGVEFDRDQVRGWLWAQVTPERSTDELAYFYYALEHLGEVDRERFFQQCDRWPKDGFPQPQWVRIEEGTFLMGSPETEPERSVDEGPQHEVTLAAFELAPTTVTNTEYARFDPSHQPEDFSGQVRGDELGQHPVVNVSWWAAYLYCRWLGGALPTEAQWEYACRAGTRTPFSFSDNITPAEVNYNGKYPYAGGNEGEYRECTVPVGSLPENPWDIHEMHGNVREWCLDWYGNYTLPVRAGDGYRHVERARSRVVRGGSWGFYAQGCRSAGRFWIEPGYRGDFFGFRPARVIT